MSVLGIINKKVSFISNILLLMLSKPKINAYFSPMFRFLFYASFFISNLLLASVIELPDLVRESSQTIRVAFESNNDEYKKLGLRAFSMHGAYRLVKKGADYNLNIYETESADVLLKISRNSEVLYESNIRGDNPYHSFLKALDRSIELTGRPLGLKPMFAGQFAFVAKRNAHTELYQSDIFFKEIKQMTFDQSLLTRPRWSPDQSSLLFTSYYNSGFPDLFKMNLKTKERSTVAAFKGTNTGGVYSPNGRAIAMTLSVQGNSDLYIINLDTQILKRVAKTQSIESNPSWSPEGDELVFMSDKLGKPQLYRIDASGGQIKRIRTEISKYCTEPEWNPLDRDLIVFTASIDGKFQIVQYSFKEGESVLLTDAPGGALEPSWMPDGRHLVYTERYKKGLTRLMLVDSVTKKVSPLHSGKLGAVSGGAYGL